ncbi:enoyl-CoA hydratase [Tsukamurella soli]|uniref:Enoyl-CoA hydratase n=1 Tax=Tsukamurella soli TaxID=644556 RepID=A0ABP8JB28_9ACTN
MTASDVLLGNDDLRVEIHAGAMTVTFTRPERLNAFGAATSARLAELIRAAGDDPRVRCVVITGEGRAFCTGADLSGPAIAPAAAMEAVNSYVRAIAAAPIPVVAKVNGPCAGMAVGLALACDIVIAAESSYFLLPFVGIGLMPDAGTTALVPAGVGRMRALGMALLGDRVCAAAALAQGMITRVCADGALDAEVDGVVERLASGPQQAIRATKRAINAATLGELGPSLDRETSDQIVLLGTDDHREGVAAMLGKRKAVFGR